MSTNFPATIDSFVNPTASDKLSDPATLHHVQHANVNDSVSALETKLGINFSAVPGSVDYALQVLEAVNMTQPKGGYKEVTYTSVVFPSIIIWYVDSSKAVTLIRKDITYGPATKKFVAQIEWKLYDGTVSNIIKRTITDVITRTGPRETSRSRVIA